MGFKKMDQEISFADLILKSSMGNNRCLEQLNKNHESIEWKNIESILRDRASELFRPDFGAG